jgi:hypothetical protein
VHSAEGLGSPLGIGGAAEQFLGFDNGFPIGSILREVRRTGTAAVSDSKWRSEAIIVPAGLGKTIKIVENGFDQRFAARILSRGCGREG